MGVPIKGVCLERTSGDIAQAPRLGILGRGVHPVHGQWGTLGPTFRTTLGTALFVSGRPRDRVGLGNLASEHARHQFERDVHRIDGSIVDRRGIYGESGSGAARKSRLFREAHRARTRHGCLRNGFRITARTTLSGAACFSLLHRYVSSTYTILAEPRGCSRTLCSMNFYLASLLRRAFELV